MKNSGADAHWLKLFQELVSVPTAPFYEQAVMAKASAWVDVHLAGMVSVRRTKGGIIVRYQGAGRGPALALAAHMDHPAFHLSGVTRKGAKARLRGGLLRELLPGAEVEAFAALPRDNTPSARGILGDPNGDMYPVTWTQAPSGKAQLAFATLGLVPYKEKDNWLSSRSIDDVLGCAASLEALRRVARARLKTNLTVLLHRAEEVGFIGALDFCAAGAVRPGDSVLSVETSKEMPEARPGKGPVIRLGDKACLFDPNLIALLDQAAGVLKTRGIKVQRTRLTGGTCEATAYLAYGYETAGVAIPLVNYHNGGPGKVAPEMVRREDAEGMIELMVESARLFPEAVLRGTMRSRLSQRHHRLSKEL